MSETKAPCGVCRGAYKEHFDEKGTPITQHAYTEQAGDLKTHKEAAEAAGGQRPQMVMQPPVYMGNAGLSVARLVELLLEKGFLSNADALYIASMGPKNGIVPQYPSSAEETN